MFISNCQITNYKSFRQTPDIPLRPGFNVVVGQNNAGKSAFLEVLTLTFGDRLHRSLKTNPHGNSSALATLDLSEQEFLKPFREVNAVRVPARANAGPEQALIDFQRFVSKGVRIVAKVTPGQFEVEVAGWSSAGHPQFLMQATNDGLQLCQLPCTQFENFLQHCFAACRERIYLFRAERLNVGEKRVWH
jgi:hypothetical protein